MLFAKISGRVINYINLEFSKNIDFYGFTYTLYI